MLSYFLRDLRGLCEASHLTQDLTPLSLSYEALLLKHGEHLRSNSEKENSELEHQAGFLDHHDHAATKIVPTPPITAIAVSLST